jgi:prepilin-type N-terminal cleavage/methylation domain-containing protein
MRAARRAGTAAASWDRRSGHLAHTLIELLVVIGIIGVLAALYLTALSAAKAKARQGQCANNLGQLGVALEHFVLDNHGYPFAMGE